MKRFVAVLIYALTITAGQVEKLKVDQCKVYLRKYGLRLTGKKDVLMERIKEHLEYVVPQFVCFCNPHKFLV